MNKKLKNKKKITVGLISLGCPKNTVDSESMLGKLAAKGWAITGQLELADVVIVNTCGFIEPAKQEAIEQLHEVAAYKDSGSVKRIIAAGCLAQRMGAELLKQVPQIDAIVGLADRDKIAEIAFSLFNDGKSQICLSEDADFISNDRGRLLTTGSHYAYLRISEGCNRNCSFCTIPSIRGKFRSKPLKDIAREASELAKSGVKELILIAQDSSNYGKDIGLKDGLAELLGVLEQFDFKWIRVMYLYPSAVSEKIIEKIASSEKVLNYIDMPIQHINDDILKSMRRSDTKEKTTNLINRLREAMPDVVLRTTIITGYPGETPAQHRELVDYIKWARFDALGCFTYFAEQGTPAAEIKQQISQETKDTRLDEIMLTQQEIVFEKNKKIIGSQMQVLVDSVENGIIECRYYGQAPDIDSLCIIEHKGKKAPKRGAFLNVRITGYQGYDLIAQQIRHRG